MTENFWTLNILGMDTRQLALYIVTIVAVLLIVTILVKRRG